MEMIKNDSIHLEVCPTSNIQTNVFDEYSNHPINKLFDFGISVGINTDARTISNISLSDEYQKLSSTFGWTEKEFLQCNVNSIQSAFLPEDQKNELINKINILSSLEAQ